ncbi:STAS domain-containing protein [Streptomyces bacillaris]|uniref:STAS domain-containing protein n=1 Tax=Streptomyces TaxID=1883 RepID=UPI00081B1C26|nr:MULTISPECIES: STAS domain-containing protein [Streptomyces]MBT3077828.1 STAS domain-containing protein [Streptomyces sp. COG21]MBT3084672.1 STAS domain-containing protein [Streptomyces sp. COG20]MBT3095539.1 STAS domain-containing protein [Streptomyces sp. CBG30]MBT3103380.1 STAS domain-containing protein [Streptomyces sp. COG19]MBT3107859.1 STAS domain-containing protein [Streptomyces sp. CYG20]
MVLLSYHLDDAHLVVELSDAVDLDNEAAIERELLRLMPCCGPSTLIVDVVTPLLTARALGVLLRVRADAGQRGVSMAVVARFETAREVLGAAALNRILRVAHTLAGAELRSRGCLPGAEAPEKDSPTGGLRDRLRRRIRTADGAGPGGRAVGPHAATSLPRLPKPRFPRER